MAQPQDSGAGVGNTSMTMTDPLVCWESDIETSSVSSDSSDEHVERNADKARRREAREWVDVAEEDDKDASERESESDAESDVLSRMSVSDKLKVRAMLLKLARDPTARDELKLSLTSLGVTALREARRGFMTRQEFELGSLASRRETDLDSCSEMAPGPDEASWSDSDSDLDSGDEGDHEVESLSSGDGEGEGEGEGDAGTPGSSLAASASGTQLGVGCRHELQEEGSDC